MSRTRRVATECRSSCQSFYRLHVRPIRGTRKYKVKGPEDTKNSKEQPFHRRKFARRFFSGSPNLKNGILLPAYFESRHEAA